MIRGDTMKKMHLSNLSHRKLCNLLLFFHSVPLGIISVIVGYYFSFVPKEVEILRKTVSNRTVIIEQQSIFLWCLVTVIIFIWGFFTLRVICECIYRILEIKNNTENKNKAHN